MELLVVGHGVQSGGLLTPVRRLLFVSEFGLGIVLVAVEYVSFDVPDAFAIDQLIGAVYVRGNL